jgi:hypothetical protein
MDDVIPRSTSFVQQPDYVGFRKVSLPIRALGVVYDGADPYTTPLGVIFKTVEEGRELEVYIPRNVRREKDVIVYSHDLDAAFYVRSRNGFEENHLHITDLPASSIARQLIRAYFQAQNAPAINQKYLIEVEGQ